MPREMACELEMAAGCRRERVRRLGRGLGGHRHFARLRAVRGLRAELVDQLDVPIAHDELVVDRILVVDHEPDRLSRSDGDRRRVEVGEVDRDVDGAHGGTGVAPCDQRADQHEPGHDRRNPRANHQRAAWCTIPRRPTATTNPRTTSERTPTHATGHAAGRDGVTGAYPAATGSGCPYPLASIARSFVSALAGVLILRYVSQRPLEGSHPIRRSDRRSARRLWEAASLTCLTIPC